MLDSIIVTVEADHLGNLESVADQLRAAGMHIHQVLGSVGVITGDVADAQRPAIVHVPGVASVEDQTEYQLPDPGSAIQ